MKNITFSESEGSVKVLHNGIPLKPIDRINGGRLIFADKEIVVKIDTTPNKGSWIYRQTAAEIDFLECLVEDKEFFPKIYEYGRTPKNKFYYIVQKKYSPRKKANKAHREILNDLVFKYNLKDIFDFSSLGDGNWMVTKEGNVIIYDFGNYA